MHSWARVSRILALLVLALGLLTTWTWHRSVDATRTWRLFASPAASHLDTPQDAMAAYAQGLFEELPSTGVGRGLTVQDLWLVLELPERNSLGRQAFLTVSPPHLDQVDLYQVIPGTSELRHLGTSGYRVQPSRRPLGHRQAMFAVQLAAQSPDTLLVRVHSRTASAALVTLEATIDHQASEFQEGVVMGALALLTVLTLTLTVILRTWAVEDASLTLTWLVLCCAIYLAGWHGVLTLWFDWSLPLWSDIQDTLVVFVGLWGLYRWAADMQRMRRDFPWLTWAMKLPILVSMPAGLFAMSRGWSPMVGGVVPYAALLLLVGLGVLQQVLLRIESPTHAILGWLVAAGLGVQLWAESGGIPYTAGTAYGWHIMLVAGCIALLLDSLARAMTERMQVRLDRDRLHAMLVNEKSQLEMRVDDRARALQTANEELRLTESSQRELLSMASHEFRTPAAMIKGTLDALELVSSPLPQGVMTRLERLRTASSRLIFLANKLIAHDRWRELSVQPQLRPLWVRAWVLEVMGEYDDDIPVRLSLPTQDIQMMGDAVLLRIALQTLIDNALVHCAGGAGVVKVALGLDGTHLALTVTDAGPGVPDDEKAQVFERFFSASTDQAQGLGLSIVAAVARMHGGEARVSDVLPHGARFHMVMPHLGILGRAEDDEDDDDA